MNARIILVAGSWDEPSEKPLSSRWGTKLSGELRCGAFPAQLGLLVDQFGRCPMAARSRQSALALWTGLFLQVHSPR